MMTDKITIDRSVLQKALELLMVGIYNAPELQLRRTQIIDEGLKALAAPAAGIPATLTPAQLADRIESGERWVVQPTDIPPIGCVNHDCDKCKAVQPCPTCVSLARTVMLDQVSFDRKPDCYGIRQITDDEGVEEWEDIRTSPDVAREEANDMMATGRGEIYEVVPLWATPQPAPGGDRPQPQRLPLTVAEVESIIASHDYELHGDRARYIVRMTEQAHGITGEDK